jgi:hypothetical protein
MRKPARSAKLHLTTETITVLAAERLGAVAGGQRDPDPLETRRESVCYCYTSR